ncbi:HpcH/HpaI aldolase/citrate lyase family protein [Plastorhodobacter daqingensis]|uniref:HpcH/HpaI aldolase/citrate lyase family protein n=1 Tax=Plastorhodobacter daqingensis TaxID=1387281 RepID=A0ABW2UKJ9_9RHOB
MDHAARPFRSVLYIPGSKGRALEKAQSLPADAIIFDLEDAVAVSEKARARALLVQALMASDYGRRARIVRINGLETPWGHEDLAALRGMAIEGVLLPKVNAPGDIAALAELLPDLPLWAMIETPRGVLASAAIAAHPRMAGLVLGTNDLAKELGASFRADRLPLLASLQHCLLAARSHGLVCLDGVYNAFMDEAGLRNECAQGRDMGFDGKTLIHPAQLATANQVFAPSEEEINLARRQMDAHAAAEAEGQGVAVVDGRIVENLHIVTARQILSRAALIAEMENE